MNYTPHIDLPRATSLFENEIRIFATLTRLNSWMTYGEPLHRLREFGVTVKELDLIDEAPLTMEQMKAFCAFL